VRQVLFVRHGCYEMYPVEESIPIDEGEPTQEEESGGFDETVMNHLITPYTLYYCYAPRSESVGSVTASGVQLPTPITVLLPPGMLTGVILTIRLRRLTIPKGTSSQLRAARMKGAKKRNLLPLS